MNRVIIYIEAGFDLTVAQELFAQVKKVYETKNYEYQLDYFHALKTFRDNVIQNSSTSYSSL